MRGGGEGKGGGDNVVLMRYNVIGFTVPLLD